ncbi:AlpA family phage regulatory protein [Spongiibacter nanhainus]|uniref:AlpA family phage regulatory protein n=2 Tax=Spongiibacter nanhainus TaxID=2794344 RepID=A0A7T4URN0_9GAMM|nr:AlpA family phage regulatory protein [Spongiibacter nanhainus]
MPKPLKRDLNQSPNNLETANSQRNIRIIRVKDVMLKTGLSKSHIYLLANKGLFPSSLAIVPGGASRGWVESEVDDWVMSRIATRKMEDC